MINKPCRIAILGAGRIGRLHAENIIHALPQFKLVGVADPLLDRDWADSLSIPVTSDNPEVFYNNPEVDAILIASPSSQHLEQLLLASNAGKAIFCEKPLGLDEQEIQAALKIIASNNTLLQVGFNRRFDPDFATMQKNILNGELGSVQVLKITSRDPACPSLEYIAQSGGLFMDMSIHDFDMARFMANSEVIEVYAQGARLINPDFETYNDIDTAIVQLKFANGALGVIDNSRQAAYGYDQRVEVFGSTGALWVNNRIQNKVNRLSIEGHHQAKPLHFFLERYKEAYVQELKAFYTAWCENKPSPVPGEAGLQALRIAKAAQESLKMNQPVRVNLS